MGKFYTNRRTQALLLLLSGIGALSGCVERRYTISNRAAGRNGSRQRRRDRSVARLKELHILRKTKDHHDPRRL